jgi:hypothetical protein
VKAIEDPDRAVVRQVRVCARPRSQNAAARLVQSSVVIAPPRGIAHSWVKDTKRPAGRSTPGDLGDAGPERFPELHVADRDRGVE